MCAYVRPHLQQYQAGEARKPSEGASEFLVDYILVVKNIDYTRNLFATYLAVRNKHFKRNFSALCGALGKQVWQESFIEEGRSSENSFRDRSSITSAGFPKFYTPPPLAFKGNNFFAK